MPQTRFVLQRAMELNHRIIVVVNKVDRPDARIAEVVEEMQLLMMELDATDEQLYEALRLACAEDFIRPLPLGLDTPVREQGGGFSEGQLQRLCIARALLSTAPILLLDEATSALDIETEQKVLKVLNEDYYQKMNGNINIAQLHQQRQKNIQEGKKMEKIGINPKKFEKNTCFFSVNIVELTG